MTFTDISTTDSNFRNYISLGDYNSTMNFVVGTTADIDINDNEYIRIRAYSINENLTFTHNSSY